jgi:hypothetical protein
MQVYTAKPTSGDPEKNQGMRVALDVTDGLMGHNVTCGFLGDMKQDQPYLDA